MEDCYLHDREFKIAFRRKLNEIQKEKRKKNSSMNSRIKLMDKGVLYQRN